MQRIVAWLREGYPQGVPERDYQPLMALLRRQLSEDEMDDLGNELVARGIVPADRVDVGVGITRVIAELPTTEEMDRVTTHLREHGWPVELPE